MVIKIDSFLISAAQVDGKVASQIVNLDVEHEVAALTVHTVKSEMKKASAG